MMQESIISMMHTYINDSCIHDACIHYACIHYVSQNAYIGPRIKHAYLRIWNARASFLKFPEKIGKNNAHLARARYG